MVRLFIFLIMVGVGNSSYASCADIQKTVKGPFVISEISAVEIRCSKNVGGTLVPTEKEKAPGCYLNLKQATNPKGKPYKVYSLDCNQKVGTEISGTLKFVGTDCCLKNEARKYYSPVCSKSPALSVEGETIESAARCQSTETNWVLSK